MGLCMCVGGILCLPKACSLGEQRLPCFSPPTITRPGATGKKTKERYGSLLSSHCSPSVLWCRRDKAMAITTWTDGLPPLVDHLVARVNQPPYSPACLYESHKSECRAGFQLLTLALYLNFTISLPPLCLQSFEEKQPSSVWPSSMTALPGATANA